MSDPELDKILAEKSRRLVVEHHPAHGHVVELTAASFDKLVGSPKLTFVDFWAVWCGPCRTMDPIVERVARKLGADVNFGKLNVDEHPSVATKYEIQSIPTFMMFRNGRPVDAVIGTIQETALEHRIRKALG